MGLQSKPAVAQFSTAQAKISVSHIRSVLHVGRIEAACLGARRGSCIFQSKGINPVGHSQNHWKLSHMHRKCTERHLRKRKQVLREGCQKAITRLSAQAMSEMGILLSKYSFFKETQVETDCSYLKGGEKGRSTGLCSSSVKKSGLAGRGR